MNTQSATRGGPLARPVFPSFLHPAGRSGQQGLLCLVFTLAVIVLFLVPTGFEGKQQTDGIPCKARIDSVDNSGLATFGLVRKGSQTVEMTILDGPYEGQTFEGLNQLLGQLDRDKVFVPGDSALAVITVGPDGQIAYVNPQAHYRLGLEMTLLLMFAGLLVLFGGWTGLRALLSFLFAGLVLWKVLVPMLLKGYDPIWTAMAVVTALTAAIIFLVAGITRKGFTAFLGAFLGVLGSCLLSVWFTHAFHLPGTTMAFSETLLYSGFGHLNMPRIFASAVFLAASGAVMDLAMDVAASMDEVVRENPGISRLAALGSGIRVGRAVVGTMTTTLLLAYCGGYVTLLMAFMAQGIPLANMLNLVYVAAEVLKTLVGSFGLVTVAPFTALVGSLLLTRRSTAS